MRKTAGMWGERAGKRLESALWGLHAAVLAGVVPTPDAEVPTLRESPDVVAKRGPPSGGFARRLLWRAIRVALPQMRCRGRVLASLETEVRAMPPSPYRAGLASPGHTHLLTVLAFPPCCGPLWLSPPGEVGDPEATFLRTSPRCAGDRPPGETAHVARTVVLR